MSATNAFIAEIRAEFPRFRIVEKRGDRLSHLIDLALRVITFGGQHEYLTHYQTILGSTLYVAGGWGEVDDVSRVITLRHERVHLRQNRRYTPVGMALLYLLPFFPVGLAYGRARIEWEAYAETLRATAELRGLAAAESTALRRHILAQFVGAGYGWMWPFPTQVGRWYDEALAALRREFSLPGAGGVSRTHDA